MRNKSLTSLCEDPESRLNPGDKGTWDSSPAGETVRGIDRSQLGGDGGIICGNCSPEPLDATTAVYMRVRVIGWKVQRHGLCVHMDVLECPECGLQILR